MKTDVNLPVTQMPNSQSNLTTTTALWGGSRGLAKHYGKTTPWITLSISLIALMIGVVNNLFPLLQSLCFDYTAIIEDHQYWRLLTGHIVHSSNSHLFWDLITFLVCGCYVERKGVKHFKLALLSSILILNGYLISPWSEIAQYSGLSGILYTVVILAGWLWYKEHRGLLGALPIIMAIAKTVLEIIAQEATFVSQGWTLFYPAHLLGIVAGSLFIALIEYPRMAVRTDN
jgi:rhomboid family GlyGly-CTERM serine protease